jgi:hypothetical protein
MSEYTEKYLESLTLKQLEKLAREGKIQPHQLGAAATAIAYRKR